MYLSFGKKGYSQQGKLSPRLFSVSDLHAAFLHKVIYSTAQISFFRMAQNTIVNKPFLNISENIHERFEDCAQRTISELKMIWFVLNTYALWFGTSKEKGPFLSLLVKFSTTPTKGLFPPLSAQEYNHVMWIETCAFQRNYFSMVELHSFQNLIEIEAGSVWHDSEKTFKWTNTAVQILLYQVTWRQIKTRFSFNKHDCSEVWTVNINIQTHTLCSE